MVLRHQRMDCSVLKFHASFSFTSRVRSRWRSRSSRSRAWPSLFPLLGRSTQDTGRRTRTHPACRVQGPRRRDGCRIRQRPRPGRHWVPGSCVAAVLRAHHPAEDEGSAVIAFIAPRGPACALRLYGRVKTSPSSGRLFDVKIEDCARVSAQDVPLGDADADVGVMTAARCVRLGVDIRHSRSSTAPVPHKSRPRSEWRARASLVRV